MEILNPQFMVIGIGGVSRSGKSILANLLVAHYRKLGKKGIVFHQDDFVLPESQIPKIRNRIDWESPQSIDFQLFREVVEELKDKFDVVIAEGLFAFYDAPTNELFDKKINVKISKRTFLIRRSMDTRWGYEPTWYIDHVWQSFQKFRKFPANFSNYISVSGEDEFDMKKINKYLEI